MSLNSIPQRFNNPKLPQIESCQREVFIEILSKTEIKNGTALSVSIGDGVWDYIVLSMDFGIKKIIATDVVCNPVKEDDQKLLKKFGDWEFIKVEPDSPLPFQPESFDLIYHQDVIEHTSMPFHFLSDQYRVLKKGGQIIVGTPYRVSHWCKSGTFTLGTNFETALNEPNQEVNNLEACNWAVQRNLLVRVGGFDPIYTGIGEYHEPDAAFKIQKLGYKLVFSPKPHLFHCPSVDGFYKDRPDSFPRIINFITFYFRHIRPNTLDKFVRFFIYLGFQNVFFLFQAISKKQMGLLGAVPGTFVGLFNVLTGLRR